ncbi:hypothetical protein [Pilimelia anulata]|nr:hypothetical protein [Pilimelia anulata]
MAKTVAQTGSPAQATAVFNLAALIASDCGLPDLARHWAHRLAHTALRQSPTQGADATAALEPIINLARLHIRAGDGLAAWNLLEYLYRSVIERSDATIDGIDIPIQRLTHQPDTHHQVRTWLWANLLSTGARALVSIGRWEEARRRVAQHNGIGKRMLDGRQIAVIAHHLGEQPQHAQVLVRNTQDGEPWEKSVSDCLHIICTHGKQTAAADGTRWQQTYPPDSGLAVFHTRLNLTVIDALEGHDEPAAERITASILQSAPEDGYVVRDLLNHPRSRSTATASQTRSLTDVMEACGIDRGHIPTQVQDLLNGALNTAEQALTSRRPVAPIFGQRPQPDASTTPPTR